MGIWSTLHEKRFINRLGSYGMTRKTRLELLRGYAESIAGRDNWDGIDPQEIADHVQALINCEKQRLMIQ
jgi:hypothetical protein